jgi:hypothetical protein
LAGILATDALATGFLTAGLINGLAAFLTRALRVLAGAADFARADAEGFDFAEAFLDFDAVFAMAYIQFAREKGCRLTPRFGAPAQAAKGCAPYDR